ncbi:hypothetical protein FRB93_001235 [Tulasnella sp. JGI-2019a]|nr:hypothetical protein FRB93_001235 [Tulasnella sp. JGI-2019a]
MFTDPMHKSVHAVEIRPEGWTKFTHNDGQLIYNYTIALVSPPPHDRTVTVVTDFPIGKSQNHQPIRDAIELIKEKLSVFLLTHDGQDSNRWEVTLLIKEDRPQHVGYYVADHTRRTIFWFDQVKTQKLDLDITLEHPEVLALALRTSYWRHVTDYPHFPDFGMDCVEEIQGMMAQAGLDHHFCRNDSTSPNDTEEIVKLQHALTVAKNLETVQGRAYRNWIIARLQFHFWDVRKLNYWSTDFARIERQTVVNQPDPLPEMKTGKTLRLATLFSWIFLWNEPFAAEQRLIKAWPGHLLYPNAWVSMMDHFQTEWERILLLATIALTTTIQFLPLVPGNADGSRESFAKDVAQAFTVLSTEAAVASLFIALILKRAFGESYMSDLRLAGSFVAKMEQGKLGSLRVGIIFSLPWVLLKWAIVLFCFGFACFCFDLHHESRPMIFWIEAVYALFLLGGLLLAWFLIAPEGLDGTPLGKAMAYLQLSGGRVLELWLQAGAGRAVHVPSPRDSALGLMPSLQSNNNYTAYQPGIPSTTIIPTSESESSVRSRPPSRDGYLTPPPRRGSPTSELALPRIPSISRRGRQRNSRSRASISDNRQMMNMQAHVESASQ